MSARIRCERRPDGVRVLRAAEPLGAHPVSLGEPLRRWAGATPDRVLAAERDGAGWQELTWVAAAATVDSLAQALLDLGLRPGDPMLVLSGNSVDHLLVTLAGYTLGAPVVPVSVAYSLRSADHARLRRIAALVRPRLVFADDGDRYAAALRAVAAPGRLTVVSGPPAAGQHRLADLRAAAPTGAVRRAAEAVTGDTVAKILFTSGSTGEPKGVLNTHRMLAANQQMLRQIWPFLADEPPVLTDWLPWSHTFGGNHNLHLALCHGGTLHIDTGRPAPDAVHRTVDALCQRPPTILVNVPAGYQALLAAFERDAGTAARALSRCRLILYAGADLVLPVRRRLAAVAARATGRTIEVVSSWGATETGPAATSTYGGAREGIGVPLPGVAVKLVPDGVRQEIRVRGPSVTPGYLGGRHTDAFDEEGFYRTGDAVRQADPDDPARGLVFDGRIAEDFKLASGTWVRVGRLRTALLAAADGLSDAVVVGADRRYAAALAWPAPGGGPDLPAALARALDGLNADAGPAARIRRLLLLDRPPDLDRGEVTDKGYLNQWSLVAHHAADVERLYRDPPDPAVITAAGVSP